MGNSSSTYIAKKAATLANPITTAAVFTQTDNALWSAFVSAAPTAGSSGVSLIDGKAIYLRASGNILTGTGGTATFTPQIWFSANVRTTVVVTAATAVAGAASTALAATTNYPWFLETTLVWSFPSLVLGGYYSQYVGIASGLTTQTITTANFLSAVDLSVTTNGFFASALMGTSRTGCVVTMNEFILEVL
jgi:hypothetical protein